METVNIGEKIIYCDEKGKKHNALVTAVHGSSCVNVIYVSDNVNEVDAYGRQIKRSCSVVYKDTQEAEGNYWQFSI